MAASRKAPPDEVEAALAACLAAHVHAGDHLVAALSGGADSMVLLHFLARLAPAAGVRLSALHINHQISPNAAAWEAFCRAEAARRGVPFVARQVQVTPAGEGVEAAARAVRLQAFAEMDADFIVLGHHLDDQAETLLLQLLRGAGVPGLAAMPPLRRGLGPALLRPLLGLPRATLRAAAAACGLAHIEDESNADIAYDRNRLRLEVLPRLTRRWPGAARAMARSAGHLAEALALLDEIAAADLALLDVDGALDLARWRQLSVPRARNALRRQLAGRGVTLSAARFDALCAALWPPGRDHAVLDRAGGLLLARYRERLELVPVRPAAVSFDLVWDGRLILPLPDGSELRFTPVAGDGLRAGLADAGGVRICSRRGGERLRLAAGRPSRTLKHLYQEAGVPAWRRHAPVIWAGDAVAAVPGLGVAAGFRAGPAETGLMPVCAWR